jgi:hypothetical protein
VGRIRWEEEGGEWVRGHEDGRGIYQHERAFLGVGNGNKIVCIGLA